ncbi:predicted protein [Botrytis cinerea T4]|uniref:Uncharacterized protein n=1 Tax=Botryotinia fuckeliana (strain T4) TaxID=999810 RepID=G2XR12_BOTF4|nr:predicted protein [Botrytis cinerea T4]
MYSIQCQRDHRIPPKPQYSQHFDGQYYRLDSLCNASTSSTWLGIDWFCHQKTPPSMPREHQRSRYERR